MPDREHILNMITVNKPNPGDPFVMPTLQKGRRVKLENQFNQMVNHVGGICIEQDSKEISKIIEELYPNVKTVYSCFNGLSSKGIRPDYISDPHDLNSIDLAVIQGRFGVAENGAVWVTEKEMTHRILPFIAEHLMILLDRNSIVEDMHDAYKKIDLNHVSYGTFISGPSKTADIEQTLVMGAQGPRSHGVILTD